MRRQARKTTKTEFQSHLLRQAERFKETPDQLDSELDYIFDHNGVTKDGRRIELGDLLATLSDTDMKGKLDNVFQDAYFQWSMPGWMPQKISTIIKEVTEPYLVGTSLLTRVEKTPGQLINFGTIGAVGGNFDVPDTGVLHEIKIAYGEGDTIASAGKSGFKCSFQPEIITNSIYPVVNLTLRAGLRALARHKERKIMYHLTSQGQRVISNLNPTTAVRGISTGHDIEGNLNGSLTAKDFMELFMQVVRNGFMPNLVLLNPLSYMMFMNDPMMKTMFMNGNTKSFWGSYAGNAQARHSWSDLNGGGVSPGQYSMPGNSPSDESATAKSQYPNLNAAPVFPGYFYDAPMNVVTTQFMPYDEDNERASIILADSREIGMLVVEQDLESNDWTDDETRMYSIGVTEKYDIHVSNGGQGFVTAEDINAYPGNQLLDIPQVTINKEGTVEDYGDRDVSPYSTGS